MQTNSQTKRLTLILAALALLIVSSSAVFLAIRRQSTPFSPQEAAALRVDVATTFNGNSSKSLDAVLHEIANRQRNPHLKGVVLQVDDRMLAGDSLVEAFDKSPDVFDAHFQSVLKQAGHAKNRAGAIKVMKQLEH